MMEERMAEDNHKRQVKAIALITAACLLGDSMLYVVLPAYWRELGLASPWEVGILLSVNRFVRLPLSPLVGWAYRKISNRSGILLAVLLSVLTTACYGLAESFWFWFVLRCIWGIAWAFLRLGAYFTIIDLSDEHRGYYLGIYNGLFRLGSLFGMLLGGLLADAFGFEAVTAGFAVVALLAFPFVFRYVTPFSAELTAVSLKSGGTASLWKEQSVIWTLLSGLFVAMLFQGVFTSTLSHVIDQRESSLLTVGGIAIGAAALSGILQALRWGWEPVLAPWFGKLSDGARGRRPIFVLSLGIAAVLFAFVPADVPFFLWIGVLLAIQMTATVLTTVMDALASDVASRTEKAAYMTSYSMVTDLGAALGPMLAYLAGEHFGMGAVYWGGAAIFALLALRWLLPWQAGLAPGANEPAGWIK
jgi:MFS family permease